MNYLNPKNNMVSILYKVKFHKKPDEGRMKGLAFALDPDGYWLEIVEEIVTNKVKQFL